MAGKTGTTNKSVTKLEINRDSVYEFELQSKSGVFPEGTYIIPKQGLAYDESTKDFRRIRLSEGEESPYLDEQSAESTLSRELISFKRGKLLVQGYRSNLIRFLLASDGNLDKSQFHHTNKHLSFKYKLKDKVALFKKSAEDLKLEIKAKNLLLDAETDKLEEFLVAYYGYKPQTESSEEVFSVAIGKAEENPTFVIKNFKSEEQVIRFKLVKAFKENVLKNTKGLVTFTEGGLEVGKFGTTQTKLIEDMTSWVIKGSKEAKAHFERISEEVSKV